MPTSIPKADLNNIESIWLLMRKLEATSGEGPCLDSALILEIKTALNELSDNPHFLIAKLADIPPHLKVGMSLQHLVNFMLPLERLLNKNLTDTDFLVSSLDKDFSFNTNPSQQEVAKIPLVLVLDNIRSSFNVGAILRTAECFSLESVILAGYTPSPENAKTQKASMGVEEYVHWQSIERTKDALNELKSKSYYIIALETSKAAKGIYESFKNIPTAFVLGNERFGLDASILALCDEVRIIPLSGIKNSLNVSVTAAIAVSEWKRQYAN